MKINVNLWERQERYIRFNLSKLRHHLELVKAVISNEKALLIDIQQLLNIIELFFLLLYSNDTSRSFQIILTAFLVHL